jgi:hypothetical protein
MRREHKARRNERGAALVEFTIGALVFLTATFAVLEFSRLLWTHNALSDAARRGARYAVNKNVGDEDDVKDMVRCGTPDGCASPIIPGLDDSNVVVHFEPSSIPGVGFGYPDGAVTVSISDFNFQFVVPIFGTTLTMPDYRTTLTAESAGIVPPDVTPTPTPEPSPSPGPSTTPTPTTTPTPEPTATPTPTPAPTATPSPTPSATPTPAPSPTPTPSATPTPTPTPKACRKGEKPSQTGCACKSPMALNSSGKCM